MKTWQSYLLLTIAFAFLASGAVLSAFLDVYPRLGLNVLWLLIPVTFLFMTAVFVDVRYAVPKLLLRQKYLLYSLLVIGMAYAASICSIFMEYAVRLWLDLPLRVRNIGSPWVYVNAFSDSVLLMLVLFGIGGRALYVKWIIEADKERAMADMLEEYMAQVKRRLNPKYIINSLDAISRSLRDRSSDVMSSIGNLSGYLRNQLYEMPALSLPVESDDRLPDYSSVTNFFVSKRYRWLRHALFQAVLLVISFGTNFDAPDRPDFANKFWGFIALYLFLNILTYINVFWLFRRFKRHLILKKYIVEVCMLLLAVTIPLILTQVATYDLNPYDKRLPALIMVIMTIGTLMTLFFFIGGTAALMMHQYWIIGKRRVMLLQAETARQEYVFLKKQINPHFLFNVLNNIGILSVDEPDEALDMLMELQRLVEYQFRETDSNTTTLCREIQFLNSFLSLEGTRMEPFSFEITSQTEMNEDDTVVPTLLFIPFVENAVKYSAVIDGKRFVNVSFFTSRNSIVFHCENTFRPRKTETNAPGGLGISNTLRRLNLLYGDSFFYAHRIEGDRYVVDLTIPCNDIHL